MIYKHIHMLVDDIPVTGTAFPLYKNKIFFKIQDLRQVYFF